VSRKCSICEHAKAAKINQALIEGQSLRNIAKQFEVSYSAVGRHHKEHLPCSLLKSKRIKEITEADNIIERLVILTNETMEIYRQVKREKDYDLALKAIARAEKQAELQAKLLGELQQEGAVNITISAEWIELRAVILQALDPYPEAREKLIAAIEGTERRC